jgi:quinol monooxygenase YgiN
MTMMQSMQIKPVIQRLKAGAIVFLVLMTLSLLLTLPVRADQVVVGKFTAKPEKQDELIRLAHQMFKPSRAEPGCLSYEFYEDTQGEHTFVFVETWKDQAAIDYHFQTDYFKQFMAKFPDLIVGKPEIKVFDIASVKQL